MPPRTAVRLAYELVLQRQPTPEEMEEAVAGLRAGTIDTKALLDSLGGTFDRLPPAVAVRLAYTMLLQREADPDGLTYGLAQLESGATDRRGYLDWLRASSEFQALGFTVLGPSLHTSRCQFVKSLPRARRVLDLGGTSLGNPVGAFVSMGYPYDFEELVCVDLPPDDRHPLYQRPAVDGTVPTSRGPVRYQYHSMVDLSRYDSSSFDLVYSGQTFEHVTEADADLMLKEIHRVLRPGGVFALDTPNGRACRLQQDEFIDPDHKIEYTAAQLEDKLAAADFRVDRSWGLNYVGGSLASGTFSLEEAARSYGMFAEVEDCYLLAYVCRAG
jgi:SAM-dependent methyltransferase